MSGSGIAANVYKGVTSTVSVQARDINNVVITNSNENIYVFFDNPSSNTKMIYSGDSY